MTMPVLMYHEIVKGRPEHEYQVYLSDFQKQMKYLYDSGFQIVTFGDIMKANVDSEKSVMITFDDGYKSDLDMALPVLEKYGFKSTHFITTGYLGDGRHMDWDEIEELIRRGGVVQSHSVSHRSLGGLTSLEVEDELKKSKLELEQKFDIKVESISLPRGSFHPSLPCWAEQLGYKYIFSSWPGCRPKSFSKKVFMVGRISIHASTGLDDFIRIVNQEMFICTIKQMSFLIKTALKTMLSQKNYHYLWKKVVKKNHE